MDISDGIKKIFLAGVGAVATTGEAAKNLIDALVEKGELTVEQGKALNEELKKEKEKKPKVSKHVTVNVVNEFKDVYSAMEKMSKEELDNLKARLEALAADKDEACECEEECAEECTEDAAGETCCSTSGESADCDCENTEK